MPKLIRFFLHPASMLWLGATALSIFGYIFDQDFPDSLEENIVGVFTVFATISAAILALQGPVAQMKQIEKLETERKKSTNRASRAFLPIALSELNNICKLGLKISQANDEEHLNSYRNFAAEFKTIYNLSARSEQILRNSLDSAPPRAGIALKLILLQYQICNSRLEGLFDLQEVAFAARSPTFTSDHIIFLGYVNQLYEFARTDSEDLPEYFDPKLFQIPSGLVLSDPLEHSVLVSLTNVNLERITETRIQDFLSYFER